MTNREGCETNRIVSYRFIDEVAPHHYKIVILSNPGLMIEILYLV